MTSPRCRRARRCWRPEGPDEVVLVDTRSAFVSPVDGAASDERGRRNRAAGRRSRRRCAPPSTTQVEPAPALGTAPTVARPVWSGTITFGLVNVPVKAHSAVRDHDVHFHQLEKGTGSRIRYQKVAEKSGKEVDADEIELGFEVRRGRYVTFDRDELAELRPESTRAVELSDFVGLSPRSTRSTTSARTGCRLPTTRRRSPTSCCWRRWRSVSWSASGPW